MARQETFSTKISVELKEDLDHVCRELGLKKSHLVETAIREKLEEILDNVDLQEAIGGASGFQPWSLLRRDAEDD